MNSVAAEIIEILSEPYLLYSKWWVKVKVISWGAVSEVTEMRPTKEEAEKIKVGDRIVI